jgi:hypothetical protein
VECPVCGSEQVSPVSVRLSRGRRGTVLDATGVHVHGDWKPDAFLEVVFRCPAHESVLILAPDSAGHLAATVESRPTMDTFAPVWGEEMLPAPRRPVARLVLLRPERDRPKERRD